MRQKKNTVALYFACCFLCLTAMCAASGISEEYKVLIKELITSKACRDISKKIDSLNDQNLLDMEPLSELLEHESPVVRYKAAYTIGMLKNRKQYTAKLIAAADKEDDVKTLLALLKALRDLESTPPLSDLMIKLLEHDSPEIRQKAAYSISRLQKNWKKCHQCAAALLIAAGKEQNAYALRNMVYAFAKFNDPAVTPLLSDLMVNHKSKEVRYAAVESQYSINDPNAVPSLIIATRDPIEKVSNRAMYVLGKIGDSRAVPRLAEVIEKQERGFLDAAQALGMIGSPEGAPALRSLLRSKETAVLKRAVRSLGHAYDDKTVSSLIPLLKHKNETIARQARRSLLKIGNDEVMMYFLKRYQRNPDDASAVEAIASFGIGGFEEQVFAHKLLKELTPKQMSSLAKHLSKVSKKKTEPKQIRMIGRIDKTLFVSVILDYEAYEKHHHYRWDVFIVTQMDNGTFRGGRLLSNVIM